MVGLAVVSAGVVGVSVVAYLDWRTRFRARLLAAPAVAVAQRQGAGAIPRALRNFGGAVGLALLIPAAILVVGLPVAFAVRVIAWTIGWLTGTTVY